MSGTKARIVRNAYNGKRKNKKAKGVAEEFLEDQEARVQEHVLKLKSACMLSRPHRPNDHTSRLLDRSPLPSERPLASRRLHLLHH